MQKGAVAVKKFWETLKGHWHTALLWEGLALCGTLSVIVIALLIPRFLPSAWMAVGIAWGIDWLILSPLRWGRRLWYRRLALGQATEDCAIYAWKHYFSALLWRGWLYLLRGSAILAIGIPLIALDKTAAILRLHASSVMVDGALLACMLAAVALLAAVPLLLRFLVGWWPLPELMADSGSFWMALRRCRTLMRRRRIDAFKWWLCGIGWAMLSLVPLLGLFARMGWHLHRARWIVAREATALPPMRDGVRLYLPHQAPHQP